MTILATIVNNGTEDAESVIIQFREGRTTPVALNQVIDSIPAGSSAVARVTYDSGKSAGDPSITVTADPDNFITELDETDNSASKTLSLQSDDEPNLELSSSNIGVAPSNPVEGDEVTIYATILNAGDSEVQDVQVQFLDANRESCGTDRGAAGHSIDRSRQQRRGIDPDSIRPTEAAIRRSRYR